MTRKAANQRRGSREKGKVIAGFTMSLDGFASGPNGDLSALYPDLEALRKTRMLRQSMRRTGAVVMGRRTYDLAKGDLTGYEYQVPIFVVTHRPPAKAPKGVNERMTVDFVTEGPAAAIELARRAARGRDVTVVGGADILRQLFALDLVDEFHLGIVPVFLGAGLRAFEGIDTGRLELDQTEVLESPGRTDIRYKVKR